MIALDRWFTVSHSPSSKVADSQTGAPSFSVNANNWTLTGHTLARTLARTKELSVNDPKLNYTIVHPLDAGAIYIRNFG